LGYSGLVRGILTLQNTRPTACSAAPFRLVGDEAVFSLATRDAR